MGLDVRNFLGSNSKSSSSDTDMNLKTPFLFLFLIASAASGDADQIATSEIITRVFQISYLNTNVTGTCFAIDVDSRQYLVTAKHVVPGIKSYDNIRILHASGWKEMKVRSLYCADTNLDLIVLIPPGKVTSAGQIDVGSSKFTFVGQDLNFFGYPFAMYTQGTNANSGFPIPLVKRAMVSGFFAGGFWLDGINNPGFSGGPVVAFDDSSKRRRIVAVISGYRFDPEPVRENGSPMPAYSVWSNTGLIKCYSIDAALSAIRISTGATIAK